MHHLGHTEFHGPFSWAKPIHQPNLQSPPFPSPPPSPIPFTRHRLTHQNIDRSLEERERERKKVLDKKWGGRSSIRGRCSSGESGIVIGRSSLDSLSPAPSSPRCLSASPRRMRRTRSSCRGTRGTEEVDGSAGGFLVSGHE
ncbi:hypothetical protein Droror1_Dr00003301 [Drosera rotundifolia]